MASRMHAQVLVLASAQALFQTASVMVMTVGGLAGGLIASRPELATMPIAAMFLGTAIATFPASMWMARVGRRAGFVGGALLGACGGLTAAAGIWAGSLLLLSLGTFLVGAYQAFAQFYRFAAGEVADDAFRPRAISLVLAGGIVAAFAGPMVGRLGADLFGSTYAGSFALLALVSVVAAGILLALRIPPPAASTEAPASARPLPRIVSQPPYLVALFGAARGYGVMILAMTATPLAMVHHHHDLSSAATVIQLHVLGMFLPSFFTGSLIARFGVLRIMLSGVLIPDGPRRHDSDRDRLPLVRGGAHPARGRLELPLHRRHDAADDHIHSCREGSRPGYQRHDHLRRRPRLLIRSRCAASGIRMAASQRPAASLARARRRRALVAGRQAQALIGRQFRQPVTLTASP
jgi:MFS family permease